MMGNGKEGEEKQGVEGADVRGITRMKKKKGAQRCDGGRKGGLEHN